MTILIYSRKESKLSIIFSSSPSPSLLLPSLCCFLKKKDMVTFSTRYQLIACIIMSAVLVVILIAAIFGEKTFNVKLSRERECLVSRGENCTIQFLDTLSPYCEWDCSNMQPNATKIVECYQISKEICPQKDGTPHVWGALFVLFTLVAIILVIVTVIFWLVFACTPYLNRMEYIPLTKEDDYIRFRE